MPKYNIKTYKYKQLNMNKKKIIKLSLIIIFIIISVMIAAAYTLYSISFSSNTTEFGTPNQRIFIYEGTKIEDLACNLYNEKIIKNEETFLLTAKFLKLSNKIMPCGSYTIDEGMSNYHIIRKIERKIQTPVRLSINNMRLPSQFAQKVSAQIMADSAEIMNFISDKEQMEELGYSPEELFSLVISNTYEVWWTTSVDDLMKKLKREHDNFWNEERLSKAQSLKLTPKEVAILASIVDEETNYKPEKSTIARVYLNRIDKGMKLESCPTVKYALKDFSITHVLYEHTATDNPYNTYKYAGLPPGPIRLPEIYTIDAVLNAEKHNYIFMCTDSELNGRHKFAKTLSEHNRNAEKYYIALKKWKKNRK